MIIRLSKYLSDAGICSRRKAEEEILKGRASVNGEVVRTLGTKVDTDVDKVAFDGVLVSNKQKLVYLMLHKPEGYVSTASDERGRPTVMELVQEANTRLVPVGRLDYNTSGLLLLTNDGDLTYKLTHPKHEVAKTYIAKIAGSPTPDELNRFRKGLFVDYYKTSPAKVAVLKTDERSTTLKITIHEGRNRQVRKMCEAIGHQVISLKRVATGSLRLGDLEKGRFRYLSDEEVRYLERI